MAIDVNGIFGRWPVRTPGIWEPAEYLRKMDRFGIERSLLTATAALLDNTTLGNDRIANVIQRFPDRFLGAAVINPQPSPERAASEAQRCLEQGFVALRLYPGHHAYPASDTALLDPVMEVALNAEVPVILTLRISGSTGFSDTPAAQVRLLAAHYPEAPIILSGGSYRERLQLTRITQEHPNLYLDITQMHGSNAIENLCEALGCARLLLGTGMGVLYASPALRKIATANIPEADREAIRGGNARRLLRIT